MAWEENEFIEQRRNWMNETENIECPAIGGMSNRNGRHRSTDITGVSGIYKIVNKTNGKYYVGSSNNIDGMHGRWYEHINDLRANRHDNDHLQKSWNKYGKDAFEFIIVKEVSPDKLLIEEQIYLTIASVETDKTYNMNFLSTGGGGFTGHRHTEESKLKTSRKLKGIPKRNRGTKRPQVSGNKNPQWKSVNSITKSVLLETYKKHGYGALKSKAKETFHLGATVVHRLSKEFRLIPKYL